MNVTELVAAVQSKPQAGSAKTDGSQKAGLFESLLTDGVQKTGDQQAENQLLDLISQLSGEQISQLMAMFGLHPQLSQTGQPVALYAAGNDSVNLQTGTQSMLLSQGFPQVDSLIADLFAAAGQVSSIRDGKLNSTGLLTALPTSQFSQNLSELLTGAGISVQETVNKLQDALKNGDNLVTAFAQLAEHAKQQLQLAKRSADQTPVDGAVGSKLERSGLREAGSQIRPDILSAVAGSGEPPSAKNHTADGSSEKPAVQPSAVVTDQTASAQNITAPALPLVKNSAVVEGQPTATQVKMSSTQFESDFSAMVVKQATLTERGGLSEMRITLTPQGLGEIHIRIQGEGGILSLQIAADSQHARSLLDANLGILKQHLEAQGMQLNRVEVISASSSAGMSTMEQGMFDGRSRQQQDNNQQQANKQASANTAYQFDEEMIYQQAANMSAGQYDWTA